ncbi:MAG: TAXI family TRAP transporter solute-binding subunit [Gemmatimonadetes bacterium]|nr:MAG: TAXI family TRAP transporter solute-binding subunit [Gemmatimonadota bacterium]
MRYISTTIAIMLAMIYLTGCQQKPSGQATSEHQPSTPTKTQYLTIGTGGVTGVYFPVGGAIAKLINSANTGINITVESTGGSVFNAISMGNGQLDLGMTQSDVAYQAYHGEGEFEGKAIESLRVLFSLHPEPMHLIARRDANITRVTDLAGKKVNLGNPGSGTLNFANAILAAYGMSEDDLGKAEFLKASEAPDFLRDGRIDAFFYPAGVGNAAVQDICTTTDVVLIPIMDDAAETLIRENPYYAKSVIPPGIYNSVDEPVPTVGVKALFSTTTRISEETAYTIVKTVLDNFEAFKAAHGALASLEPANLLEAIPIDLHPGSERAFKEAGLIGEKQSTPAEDSTATPE